MTYELVENFAAGLDNRKSPLTSPGGTLTRLKNAVITPGGEIAKRRAFVQCADLTGSFGLAATSTDLYVFGRNVAPPTPAIGVPGVTLKGLLVPNSDPDLAQWDYDVFDGYIYMSAHDPGVAWRHFYAGPPATAGYDGGDGRHQQGAAHPHLPVQGLRRHAASICTSPPSAIPTTGPPAPAPATSTCLCRIPIPKRCSRSRSITTSWRSSRMPPSRCGRSTRTRRRTPSCSCCAAPAPPRRGRRCNTAPATCSTSTPPASAR